MDGYCVCDGAWNYECAAKLFVYRRVAQVGKYSYRLKQIDNDGKFVYGQVIEATVGLTPGTVFLDNDYRNRSILPRKFHSSSARLVVRR